MKVSVGTTRTPAGRRKETFGRTNENQNFAWHSLPQQLTLRTPQRRIQDDPKSQNIGVPVMMHRTVNDPSRRSGPDPGRANRSPRMNHHEEQDRRKHQSYDASTEVTARTTNRNPRTEDEMQDRQEIFKRRANVFAIWMWALLFIEPFRQGRLRSRQHEACTNSQRTTENKKQSSGA